MSPGHRKQRHKIVEIKFKNTHAWAHTLESEHGEVVWEQTFHRTLKKAKKRANKTALRAGEPIDVYTIKPTA